MPRTSDALAAGAEHFLKGERVAFTGRLASMSRREAEELVITRGGRLTPSVNRGTTLLVIGMDGWPLLRDGRLSNKLQKAESLQKGPGKRRLRVWSEEQFLERVGRKRPDAEIEKPMDAAQVSALVGVAPETLHRWELLGLVRSNAGRYDFRDLVSLQTIAALVSQGAHPSTINQSVRSLARVLPGTDRPLAQLKLLADQDSLVAEVNGSLMSPGGQLIMRFEPDRDGDDDTQGPPALALSLGPTNARGRSAEEWFDIGCSLEDSGEMVEAERAYREALARLPTLAEAHFNLANVLRATNRSEAAEERYRAALEHDATLAEAWFNLADVLDESDRTDEAIDCLRAALKCDPQYADAHYNLAVCCEKSGLMDEAREHWREYVRLDPTSEWAAFARGRLTG